MLAGMLAFGAVPGVASTTASLSTTFLPNIASTSEGVAGNLGTILIDNLAVAGLPTADTIKVSLPGGVDLGAVTVTGSTYLPGTTTPNALNSNYGGVIVAPTGAINGSSFSFTVNTTGAYGTGAVTVSLPYQNMSGVSTGEVNALVTDTLGIIGGQSVLVGNVVSAGTIASVLSTVSIAPGSTSTGDVTLNLGENTPNALEGNAGYLKFKLPSYFTWTSVSAPSLSGGWSGPALNQDNNTGLTAGQVAYYVDGRELRLYFGPSDSVVGQMTINGKVQAAYNAPTGDIVASVSGTNPGVTGQSLTVGTSGTYGVTTTNGTGTVILGQSGQTLPTFDLNESVAGTLIAGRTLTLTLPSGVLWQDNNLPQISSVNGGGVTFDALGIGDVSSDGSTLTVTVDTVSSGTATEIQFANADVNVNTAAATGPLNITINGSGINTTVQDGTIASSVTATATITPAPSVVIGQQNQKISDFTIAETAAGNLEQHTLSILAPTGVTFDGPPTVAVTAGNLAIGSAMLTGYNNGLNNEINIPITTQSSGSTPGTISVSGLSLNIDNSVPVGPISLEIGGNALIDAQTTTVQTDSNQYGNFGITGNYVATVPVANVTNGVVTTGQTGVSGTGSAQFTVGGTVYSVNGTQYVMDVAPYITNGRTFVPVRYLADALGATTAWDATTQTVTLTKGSNTVVLTIGSTTETVNGTAQTMDVAPTIVNSRTMLPARWVAEALGATVGWIPTSQEVLINY